jgi:hypothetical protein
MIRRALGLAALCAALLVAACEKGPSRPDKSPEPAPSASALFVAQSEAPPALSALVPSVSLKSATALARTWEGRYEAKRAKVEISPAIAAKDKTWEKEDGKASTGPGTITLTISPTGEIKGQGVGALGSMTVSGHVDGEMIRASLFPADPRAVGAMTGVLVGMIKADEIVAEIHVAGGDASVVREAAVALRRK